MPWFSPSSLYIVSLSSFGDEPINKSVLLSLIWQGSSLAATSATLFGTNRSSARDNLPRLVKTNDNNKLQVNFGYKMVMSQVKVREKYFFYILQSNKARSWKEAIYLCGFYSASWIQITNHLQKLSNVDTPIFNPNQKNSGNQSITNKVDKIKLTATNNNTLVPLDETSLTGHTMTLDSVRKQILKDIIHNEIKKKSQWNPLY